MAHEGLVTDSSVGGGGGGAPRWTRRKCAAVSSTPPLLLSQSAGGLAEHVYEAAHRVRRAYRAAERGQRRGLLPKDLRFSIVDIRSCVVV